MTAPATSLPAAHRALAASRFKTGFKTGSG